MFRDGVEVHGYLERRTGGHQYHDLAVGDRGRSAQRAQRLLHRPRRGIVAALGGGGDLRLR